MKVLEVKKAGIISRLEKFLGNILCYQSLRLD